MGLRAGTSALFLPLLVITRVPSTSAGSHIDGAFPVDATTLPLLSSVADLLIRVDKRYPSGKDHRQFKNFCKRYVESADSIRKDFFIATVGIESTAHTDNHNLDLATELGAPDEKKWPQYYFLKKGSKDVSEAIKYGGDDKSADALAAFVQRKAGVRFGGTGPLEEMDGIASDFATEIAGGGETTPLIEKAKARAAKYSAGADKEIAEVYLKVMAKAVQKGVGYFRTETDRVSRMLEDGKMNDVKRRLFEDKLRVLGSFADPKKGKQKS